MAGQSTFNRMSSAISTAEHKVSVWFDGYPHIDSVMGENDKNTLIGTLKNSVESYEEALKNNGMKASAILFPSILLQHGQLVIGCEDNNSSKFVMKMLGAVKRNQFGFANKFKVAMTLQNDSVVPTFSITVPEQYREAGA